MNTHKLTNAELLTHKALSKSKPVAYLLGAFLGVLGVHRFYCEEYVGASIYLALFAMSLAIPFMSIVLGVFLLVDLFATWGLVDNYNKDVAEQIIANRETK